MFMQVNTSLEITWNKHHVTGYRSCSTPSPTGELVVADSGLHLGVNSANVKYQTSANNQVSTTSLDVTAKRQT